MKFWTVVGGILFVALVLVVVGVVVKNNVPVVNDWVNSWGQEQPAEDENITPEVPDMNEDENGDLPEHDGNLPAPDSEEPEANLQFFVFENDYAKILVG